MKPLELRDIEMELERRLNELINAAYTSALAGKDHPEHVERAERVVAVRTQLIEDLSTRWRDMNAMAYATMAAAHSIETAVTNWRAAKRAIL